MKTASAIFFALFCLGISFRMFFKTNDDFYEAIRHWFTPDIISLFKGEYADDCWNELKLVAWLFVGGLGAYGGLQLFDGS